MLPPGRLTLKLEPLAVGGLKTVRFRSVRGTKDTGDPAIVRLLQQKPLRPVVLRPHLSAGLPLNSPPTMRWRGRPVKRFFNPSEAGVRRAPRPPGYRTRPPRPPPCTGYPGLAHALP